MTEFESGPDTIGMGYIETFKNGVAWGTFDTGMTFDLPVSPMFHLVGDQVRFDASDPDETGSEYMFFVIGDSYCTVFWCDASPEGYSVSDSQVFSKNKEAMN